MTALIGYLLGLFTWIGLGFYFSHLEVPGKWIPVWLAGAMVWASIALMTLGVRP